MTAELAAGMHEPSTVIATELNWLLTKKVSYYEQLRGFQEKMQQKINDLVKFNNEIVGENKKLQTEVDGYRKLIIQVQKNGNFDKERHKEETQKLTKEIYELKKAFQLKDEKQKKTLEQLLIKEKLIKDFEDKIIDLENSLESKIKQNETTVQQLTQVNNKNVQNMIQKYQQLIEQRVSTIERKYQEELQQIKANNRSIIQQLEERSKLNITATKEEVKKNSEDIDRLINENKRLLTNLNEGKRKIMNLENELQASRQQNKIIAKQKEILSTNGKREIQCLKEDRQLQQEKLRKMQDQLDEAKWTLKQIEIGKQKQVRKIKQEGQKMMDELLGAYKAQIADFKVKIKQLKDQNIELGKKCDDFRRERDSTRQVAQYLKKEKQIALQQQLNLQNKKHQHDVSEETEVSKLKSLNSELKKEIMRKSAEVQVLKQQVSRLKSKVNKITVAYQQNSKAQQLMQKQNKMLLSEIVFLRDKNKSKFLNTHKKPQKDSRNSSRILDMQSQRSLSMDNDGPKAELEMYKELIVEMEKDMNEAVAKLDQKNTIIQKQKAIIDRLERALNK